jgi:hypothetical protein
MMILDGHTKLRVHDRSPCDIDLNSLITTVGPHRIEYRLGTVTSNALDVSIK